MQEKELRKFIQKALLNEFMNGGTGWDSNNDIALFHGYPSGTQRFPYGNIDTPENINRINQEKIKYADNEARQGWVDNKDIYMFPMDEFVLGLKVETAQAEQDTQHTYHVMSVAQTVLNRLCEDPQYYSKLTTVK